MLSPWRLRVTVTWKGFAAVLLLTVLASITCSYVIYLRSRLPFKLPTIRKKDSIPMRRELARRVMKAQRHVEVLAVKGGGGVAPTLALELLIIAAELDSRITSEGYEVPAPRSASGSTPTHTTSSSTSPKTTHVCPEVYHGKGSDPTFYHNFAQVQCHDAPAFKDVLTIILSTKAWASERVKFVSQNIRKYYDVNIVVLSYRPGAPVSLGVEGVTVLPLYHTTTESYAINKAVAQVKTPYTLLADSLTHFSGLLCSLERLVRTLDQVEEAGVAAGSYRTKEGTWNHGCLQRRMENYQLAYVRGYEHSRHECMFCDDVLGPFVARTSLLQKVPLPTDLEGETMYRNWFINVYLSDSLVVACPDVMFFVDEEAHMTRRDWLEVAKNFAVQHVWPFDGQELSFTCEEVEIKCVNIMKMVSSFLVPPCCRKQLRQELGYVQECAQELGLYFELQAGSLLGAVKTDGIMPWDFDTDVLVDCKDQETWITRGRECISSKGCSAVHISGSYWMSNCQVSFTDISCKHDTALPLPPEYRKVPTRVNYNGRLITVTPNPALVARNYYGPEYLRHETHWRYIAKEQKSQWNSCLAPGFHGCLENFPTDGNLRFMNFSRQFVGT